MSNKSYVTLEQQVCIVCGKRYDTGTLLLDKRLRERFDYTTVTGWGMCPEHQKMKDDGFIALIEVKNNGTGDRLKPNDADRTGRICHIKQHVADQVFNGVKVGDQGVAFIQEGVLEMLENMVEKDEHTDPKDKA